MLKDIFVSEVRVNILKTMLPNPEEQLHVRAIVRAVGTEINAVRRELKRLYKLGLMKKRPSGNRIYYFVDTSHAYYPELLSLVAKEEGLGAEIIKNQKKLGDVKFAVLSRGYSRGRKSNVLDVDLFMVGAVNIDVLQEIVKKIEKEEEREINYSVLGEDEFIYRKRKNDTFVNRILMQSRTFLIGDEEEFSSIMQ